MESETTEGWFLGWAKIDSADRRAGIAVAAQYDGCVMTRFGEQGSMSVDDLLEQARGAATVVTKEQAEGYMKKCDRPPFIVNLPSVGGGLKKNGR